MEIVVELNQESKPTSEQCGTGSPVDAANTPFPVQLFHTVNWSLILLCVAVSLNLQAETHKPELAMWNKIIWVYYILCVNYFSTIAIRAIQMEFSLTWLKFK